MLKLRAPTYVMKNTFKPPFWKKKTMETTKPCDNGVQ